MLTAALALLLFTAGLMVTSPPSAHAATVTAEINGLSFKADDANVTLGARVTGYDTSFGLDVTIPKTVTLNGTDYMVTIIDSYAFANKGITSVEMPDTVTSIGNYGFYNNDLSHIDLPDSLTGLGNYAFTYDSLTTVELPHSVESVGNFAFSGNSLDTLVLSQSLTSIGIDAFQANDLTSVTIPGSVDWIGKGAFRANPLTDEWFAGDAPAITSAAEGSSGSFGIAADQTLYYHGAATGFASPTWEGYQAMPYHIVSFDTEDGTAVGAVNVVDSATVTAPDDPTRDGYTFAGWYTDSEATQPFNFDTPITDDLTLYSGWEVNSYTVTFDTGDGTAVPAATVTDGATIVAPDDPTRDNYTFTGWYTDSDTTQPFNFDTPVTADMTLYAGWGNVVTTTTSATSATTSTTTSPSATSSSPTTSSSPSMTSQPMTTTSSASTRSTTGSSTFTSRQSTTRHSSPTVRSPLTPPPATTDSTTTSRSAQVTSTATTSNTPAATSTQEPPPPPPTSSSTPPALAETGLALPPELPIGAVLAIFTGAGLLLASRRRPNRQH